LLGGISVVIVLTLVVLTVLRRGRALVDRRLGVGVLSFRLALGLLEQVAESAHDGTLQRILVSIRGWFEQEETENARLQAG
jgi:hypothetical protein